MEPPPLTLLPWQLGLHNPWLVFQVQLIYSLPSLLPSPAPEDKGRRVCPLADASAELSERRDFKWLLKGPGLFLGLQAGVGSPYPLLPFLGCQDIWLLT